MANYTVELDFGDTVTEQDFEQQDDHTLLEAFHGYLGTLQGVKLVDDDDRVVTRITIQELVQHHVDAVTNDTADDAEEETVSEGEVIEGPSRVAETDEEDEQAEEGEEDEDTQDEEAENEEAGKSASDDEGDNDRVPCPSCGGKTAYERATKEPTYRCGRCEHEFDEVEENSGKSVSDRIQS